MDRSKAAAKGWRTRIDKKALEGYEKQLRNRRQEYAQYADTYSKTGRRNQAMAVGECVLKALDELKKLNKEKNLLEGSLFWTITEQKIKDTDGIKGFHYVACWHVKSDEDYYTEEEIRKEMEETRAKMEAEKEEFFADEPEEE